MPHARCLTHPPPPQEAEVEAAQQSLAELQQRERVQQRQVEALEEEMGALQKQAALQRREIEGQQGELEARRAEVSSRAVAALCAADG